MNDNIIRTHVAMWPGCRATCGNTNSRTSYSTKCSYRLEYNNELNLQFVTIMTNIHYDFILGTGSSTTNIIYSSGNIDAYRA